MMRKFLIVLSSIICLVLLFMGSFRLLAKHIYNRTDCEAFNIDNIELRTGIDIPAVVKSDCECIVFENTKTAKFTIDTQKVDFERYISRNNFNLIDGNYKRSGQREGTVWESTLNGETKELTVFIEYRL